MDTFAEVESAANYADRQALERAAKAAIKLCQWQIATAHYEAALALLPVDPHRGEHSDAERYRRQIRICTQLAGTSKGIRPTKDNPLYQAEEREHAKRVADYQDNFWRDE
ncbi:MAG: hypothetical protein WBC18_14665 [Ottowia sp.]|uniref:hypothetical protein n=1 Tax=Ottowia sp. TaxID=1898956 RepID=UPI003C78EE42